MDTRTPPPTSSAWCCASHRVHYNLGSVYEQMGKRQLARAEYQKAVELDPRFAEAQTRLDGLE